MRYPPINWNREMVDKLEKYIYDGLTVKEIAKEFKLRVSGIRKAILVYTEGLNVIRNRAKKDAEKAA